jgi:RNA polymerase sigma factor (sigma-70 family)
VTRQDPLRNPGPLIRRVYAYVAYRIGDGPDAEDVTSTVFERALRYRDSYDSERGAPLPWLLGIARRCIDDGRRTANSLSNFVSEDHAAAEDIASEAVERLDLYGAIARLDERSRDLLALRFGADLSARQIAELVGLRTNAVEVALHRILARLRAELEDSGSADAFGALERVPLARPADRPGAT